MQKRKKNWKLLNHSQLPTLKVNEKEKGISVYITLNANENVIKFLFSKQKFMEHKIH